VIEHGLAVTFPAFLDCVYQQDWYDEHGVSRHGYELAGTQFL